MGWKPCWAVLERGILSFFRNRADAATGTKRKSFRYLDDARVVVRRLIYSYNFKVVLHGSPRSPDIHDLSECYHLYDLGRHTEQP